MAKGKLEGKTAPSTYSRNLKRFDYVVSKGYGFVYLIVFNSDIRFYNSIA